MSDSTTVFACAQPQTLLRLFCHCFTFVFRVARSVELSCGTFMLIG